MKKYSKLLKYLIFGLSNKSGINNSGHRTLVSKGRRIKKKYRLVDFYHMYYTIKAVVIRLEYDPNRNAYLALICYKNGFLSYIIASEGLKPGMIINYMNKTLGSTNMIQYIDIGTSIYCVELYKNFGMKLARSAGTYSMIISKNENKSLIKLPSGKTCLVHNMSKAILGTSSNKIYHLRRKYKAGQNIKLGYKPVVRGVAKNSIDHPSGGGRGKTSQWSDCPNFTRNVIKGKKTKRKNVIR